MPHERFGIVGIVAAGRQRTANGAVDLDLDLEIGKPERPRQRDLNTTRGSQHIARPVVQAHSNRKFVGSCARQQVGTAQL